MVLGLVQAVAVVTLIASLGVPCGAYVKPAITLGMLGARRIRLVDACSKVVIQLAGALVGARLVKTLMTLSGLALGAGTAGNWLLASVVWPAAGAVVAARAHSLLIAARRRRRAGSSPAPIAPSRGGIADPASTHARPS